MRPIKLTMSAFGPYSDIQTIDFTKLNDINLFVIAGPTGAGKTTIFDAICVALYGDGSGENRADATTLRSHFAKDDVETYVQFTFMIGIKEYTVTRYPKQNRKKKKQAGFTSVEARAELETDDFILTGVTAVTNKLQDILGIDKKQFRQIVMLPQGEFKKLLMSPTKEKQEIFRKIFGTTIYENITIAFKEESKKLLNNLKSYEQEIKTLSVNLSDKYRNLDIQTLIETLSKDIELAKDEVAQLNKTDTDLTTPGRILGAVVLDSLLISLGLSTLWLSILLDSPYLPLLVPRIAQNLILIPIQFVLIGLA